MALIINSVDSYEILSKLDFLKINIKRSNLYFLVHSEHGIKGLRLRTRNIGSNFVPVHN